MRKGSKRLPNKIMLNLAGKPLFYYTVRLALELGYDYYLFHDYEDLQLEKFFTHEEILRIKQIKRSEHFAGDIHRTNEEILKAGIKADVYIFLQCTNPIRNLDLCKSWIAQFLDSEADVGLAAIENSCKYFYDGKGKSLNFNWELRDDNGCHIKPIYHETGNFYIFNDYMLKRKHILSTNNKLLLNDVYDCDINTIEDFKKAEECIKSNCFFAI